jgi:hypothetical protein
VQVRYWGSRGTPLISVTQILTLAGRIDATWFTAESAERGRAVHAATEQFDRGEASALRDDWRGYLEAYAAFMATVKPVYHASELAVCSETLRYGGRIDRVCKDLFGSPGLLDFKTSAVESAWHGQQLALYTTLLAYEGVTMGPRWACYLRPDGRYKLRQYADHEDYRRSTYDLARALGTVTIAGDHWVAR